MPRPRRIARPEPEENEYEALRAQQIAENQALLLSLELKSTAASSSKTLDVRPKTSSSRKARARTPREPTRQSSRLRKQPAPFIPYDSDSDVASDNDSSSGRRKTKKRRTEPGSAVNDTSADSDGESWRRKPRVNGRVFGPIAGVRVGAWWAKRDECGARGVHPPTVAGIFGSSEDGCYSVAVSAGYPEDVDYGDRFTYTGSGGRELKKKNLRTAPQSSDQRLERGNLALWVSAQTGKPVRVIRGYKARLGPREGYRYDGLYKVERAYEAPNESGRFKVWKFDFVRLKGQEPVDYEEKERWVQQERERMEREAAEESEATETPSEG